MYCKKIPHVPGSNVGCLNFPWHEHWPQERNKKKENKTTKKKTPPVEGSVYPERETWAASESPDKWEAAWACAKNSHPEALRYEPSLTST